jgi:Polyketide cyclase / dehydrase and lipid transport
VKIRVAIVIDAPPEVVWRAIESIERHVDWMTDAVSITFTSASRRGVGTRFDCVTRIGPFRTTDRMTVTQWTPRRAMEIEHHGAVTGRGRFTLSRRRHNRTRFAWTERLKFPWWMGGPVGALAAKPILRGVWRRNLHALKRLVESAPA